MEKYAQEIGEKDILIKAQPVDDLLKYVDAYDVFLLGPQVQYKEEWVKGIVEKKGKRYANIPVVDYGRVDGKKTFALARGLYE
jgi:PTS system cellobiose-specific IIB component